MTTKLVSRDCLICVSACLELFISLSSLLPTLEIYKDLPTPALRELTTLTTLLNEEKEMQSFRINYAKKLFDMLYVLLVDNQIARGSYVLKTKCCYSGQMHIQYIWRWLKFYPFGITNVMLLNDTCFFLLKLEPLRDLSEKY